MPLPGCPVCRTLCAYCACAHNAAFVAVMSNPPRANNQRDSGPRLALAAAEFAGALHRGCAIRGKKVRNIRTKPAAHAGLVSLVHARHDAGAEACGAVAYIHW